MILYLKVNPLDLFWSIFTPYLVSLSVSELCKNKLTISKNKNFVERNFIGSAAGIRSFHHRQHFANLQKYLIMTQTFFDTIYANFGVT